jgi:membrane-associated phospholipid phosphatase
MRLVFTLAFSDRVYRIYSIALLVFFILSICIEKGNDILLINGNHSLFFDALFKAITNLGDGIIFLPTIAILLFVRYQYAIIAAALALFHGLLISIFKRLLFPGMPRPKAYMDNDLLHFVDGVTVHSANSFPSGHTATAFCFALFVAYLCKNKWITIGSLLMATLVGYSRVYLAQHFLIDVAAGAMVGCFTTFTICQFFEVNQFPNWMDKHLRLNPNTKKMRLLRRKLSASIKV